MGTESETTTPPTGEEGKTLTQADIDRIVEDRLKRERAKFADYSDLKAKAEKLEELEASQQSEVEKLANRIAEAEKARDVAVSEALRLRVTSAKGLTPEQAEFLTGSTQEEIEAQADKLLAAFGGAGGTEGETPATPPPGNTREDLRGGTDPTTPADVDIRSIVDSIDF